MKKRVMLFLAMLAIAAPAVLGGCASTPDQGDGVAATFDRPVTQVQAAAVAALTETGFEISTSEALYVEGHRPNKFGLFVGSGGETAGVWLQTLSPGQTGVRVDTSKSLFGYAGQKDWSEEILVRMREDLGT